ncbi:hypothetical protein [Flavobacterium sp.]|uniref:hypothetical protein n=1 Tax=Flavobacterium sp. TaxID=239 RepID=UPI002C4E8B8A|nr:hypothetical protein [Flavobacterium sp.]HSD07665.1 hypothetical protein [Flavobacterium sp.]
MKNLKIIYTILFSLLYTVINAQEKSLENENDTKQYLVALFKTRDAKSNGEDITPEILKANQSLQFYKSSDSDEILFSNFWKKTNSQSYGYIYSIVKEENPDKEEENKSELYKFQWSYCNSYDNKKGTAEVTLLLVYKPRGTYFEITILPENLDELIYKGEMYGDLLPLDYNIKKQNENQ